MILPEELLAYNHLIDSIQQMDFKEEEGIAQLRIKVRLIDATFLNIREIKKHNRILAYSYYWLDSNNQVITGWDNAPHHKALETFPHHKHMRDNVLPSKETCLRDILKYIDSLLNPAE